MVPESTEVQEEVKLTEKQKLFVQEFLVDLNATRAAIRAGYSEATARQIGSENLSKLYIDKAIRKALDERAERCHIRQDYPMKYWIGELLAPDDDLRKDSTTKGTLHGQEIGTGHDVYKAPDRMRASENIAKHLGMFPNKTELDVKLPDVVFVDKKHERLA